MTRSWSENPLAGNRLSFTQRGVQWFAAEVTAEECAPLDSRAPLAFLKSRRIDDPRAEQYRPKLVEVSAGHFVAEHDPA